MPIRPPVSRVSAALISASLALAAAVVSRGAPATGRPMTLADLFAFHRVSDPQISPDGRRVAFVVTDVDMAENRTNSDIWVVAADGTGVPRQLTDSPKADSHPRWSPDGRWIAFDSTRDGDSQVYLLPVDGGEPRPLTNLSTGASGAVWSPDGRSVAFVSEVFAEFSGQPFRDAERLNRQKLEAREHSKVKARIVEHLLYRHWDHWVEGRRQHLFVVGVAADGSAAGDPRDVTPGENDAVPTSDTFSAGDDYAFSPDGSELVTTAPPLPVREQAWSTNHDVWAIDLHTLQRQNLTAQNDAADGFPRFSPNGRYLAYRAQRVPNFEADRWEVWLLDRATGQRRSLTKGWDRSVGSFSWSPDGTAIFADAEEHGAEAIFKIDVRSGAVTPVVTGGVNSSFCVSPDGQWLAFLHQQLTQPPEVARFDLGRNAGRPLTAMNAARLGEIAFTPPEVVTVTGTDGTPVQMWIVKPPHFDPAKRYPLVFWVHGGPQGAWADSWSTSWNAEVWAAQGYVLALPNPRGSTGFGQAFTNAVSRDWGGKPFEDLMACLAYLKNQPYIDGSRMAAAGASYGGYMMNWFEGQVQDFRCIVTHDGVFNFNTMYGSTDELWFDEHEHGIPWRDADFEKFSPHRYVSAWKTPALIIHNERDYRCPISEGMAAFTTLQRKGIRSKLLMFPDEGHWVLKPQNSELWHETVFDWLAEYLKPST